MLPAAAKVDAARAEAIASADFSEAGDIPGIGGTGLSISSLSPLKMSARPRVRLWLSSALALLGDASSARPCSVSAEATPLPSHISGTLWPMGKVLSRCGSQGACPGSTDWIALGCTLLKERDWRPGERDALPLRCLGNARGVPGRDPSSLAGDARGDVPRRPGEASPLPVQNDSAWSLLHSCSVPCFGLCGAGDAFRAKQPVGASSREASAQRPA